MGLIVYRPLSSNGTESRVKATDCGWLSNPFFNYYQFPNTGTAWKINHLTFRRLSHVYRPRGRVPDISAERRLYRVLVCLEIGSEPLRDRVSPKITESGEVPMVWSRKDGRSYSVQGNIPESIWGNTLSKAPLYKALALFRERPAIYELRFLQELYLWA